MGRVFQLLLLVITVILCIQDRGLIKLLGGCLGLQTLRTDLDRDDVSSGQRHSRGSSKCLLGQRGQISGHGWRLAVSSLV